MTVRTVSRSAVLHLTLSFPSAMQTRFRSEEKRSGYIRMQKTHPKYRRFSMVCIRRIGNGSAGAKSARRLTWLCKAEGKRSRSRAEFAGGVLRTAKRSFGAVACVHCVQAAHEHGLFMDVRK